MVTNFSNTVTMLQEEGLRDNCNSFDGNDFAKVSKILCVCVSYSIFF